VKDKCRREISCGNAKSRHVHGRHRPAPVPDAIEDDRASQYSGAFVIAPKGRGVLDPPQEPVIGLAEGKSRWRGMTACGAARRRTTARLLRHRQTKGAGTDTPA